MAGHKHVARFASFHILCSNTRTLNLNRQYARTILCLSQVNQTCKETHQYRNSHKVWKKTFLETSKDIYLHNYVNIYNSKFLKGSLCYRYYSSTTNQKEQKSSKESPSENPAPVKQGTLKKVKAIIDVFWIGCKALFKDVRLALKTRRKLGLYHQRDYSKLSREELRHMRQTRQDVVKTFPVTLMFMIPFIGYVAPLLAYFFPKQLLSQQFWHPDQKKEFILEKYERRSQYYQPLIKEVGVTSKEIQNNELLNLCYNVLDGWHPSNSELLTFKDVFMKCEDLSLQGMPRYHLVKICKCWLIPTAWYLPRWFLTNSLRRRILRLRDDDALILRDGIEILTPECVQQAVQFRGLDEAALCDRLKVHWLDEWVKLSTKVSAEDVAFLAHCAVFKAANFETIENRN